MRIASSLTVYLIALPAAFAALAAGETLHGRLVDCASLGSSSAGRGIAGVRLTLYDTGGKKLASKTSSRLGDYRFPKLAPGTYTLAIERKEYLPSPLLRVITLASEDGLSRDFTLDRIPMQGALPARRTGKGKAGGEYYPLLARGMLAAMRLPEFHRESGENRVNLSRFFDAEDTTEAYRALWTALLWADVESQRRPIAADVYLAHAFDSALGAANLPAPAALKPYLKIPVDSMESLVRAVRAMLLSPSGKIGPETLTRKQVPKSMVMRVIEEQMGSKAVPKPKQKAFLARIRNLAGPETARRLALLIEPADKKSRPAVKKPAPAAPAAPATPALPPQPDVEGIWKVVQDLAASKQAKGPNPVALFHVALRRLEQGQAREALAGLEQVGTLRPDYPQAVHAMALSRMAMDDTAGAERLFDSLSRTEFPEWQVRGFRECAQIQWRTGRPEKAEASLWRALGLDSKSAAAREALLLLAEVSLARDSWNPVEGLLDSLVKVRPREAQAHFWLGHMALKRRQDGVALGHFQKAAALAPQRVDFAAAVAAAYFDREECESAVKTLKPLRARLSEEGLSIYGRCLLVQGKAKDAVLEFARLQAARPSPQNLVQWARALSASGDARRAVAVIQASGFTADFEVRKALAAAQIDLGSADQARPSLERLVAAKEADAELHFLLGRAAFSLRDYSEAGKQFTLALQYQEDYPDAKYRQGMCLLKQGRSGEAHHYFTELVDSDKPSWRAKGLLGQGQAFAREEKPEAAAENLRRSFQASPSAEAAAHLALAYLRMDQNEEAAAWAAKARKLDPDEPLGLMASVDALLAAHREDEAVALSQAGLERHPEGCDFMVVAAKAQLRAGHDERARELSQRARGLCPEESAPYYYLGTLSARAGTVAEARRHFSDYMKTGGDAKRVPESYR